MRETSSPQDSRGMGTVANLFPVGLGQAVRTFGYAIYYPFFALYLRNSLHVSYGVIGLVFFFLGLLSLITLPVAGRLTDRWGRRKTYLFSLASEAIGIVFLYLAMTVGSFTAVVVASAFLNPLANMSGPAKSAYVADWVEHSERTLGYSWISMGGNAGFAAGVALGGVLLPFIGFQGVVLATVLILVGIDGTLFIILDPSPTDSWLASHSHDDRRPSTPDSAGSNERRPRTSLLSGIRGALGETLTPLRNPGLTLIAVSFLFVAILTGAFQIALPLFANNQLGVSYTLLGIAYSLNGLILMVGQVPLTKSFLGRRLTSIGLAGILLYAASLVLIGVSGLLKTDLTLVFLAGISVLSIGEILVSVPQNTLPSNLTDRVSSGRYNAMMQTFTLSGSIVSLLFAGLLLSIITNPALLWVLFVSPALPAVVTLLMAARRIPAVANRA